MSLPKSLSLRTLTRIQDHLKLHETKGADGGPYKVLTSAQNGAPLGEMRVFSGGLVRKLAYVAVAVPPIGLDSHMLFGFTLADSALPHFTLDSVAAGPTYAFHLDLIPRVDLAANLAYADAVYGPLTPITNEVRSRAGLTTAPLTPSQYAVMSPWMLVHRADETSFKGIGDGVDAYLDRWFDLLDKGLAPEILSNLHGGSLAEHDTRHLAAIFNPKIDPVWASMDRLLGVEQSKWLCAEIPR
jgi:hypothetical protein